MLKVAKNIPSNSESLLADEGRMTGFTTIKIRWWQIYCTLFYIKNYVHWEISCDHMFLPFLSICCEGVSISVCKRWMTVKVQIIWLLYMFFVSNTPNVVSWLSWAKEVSSVFSFTCLVMSNCQAQFDTSVT